MPLEVWIVGWVGTCCGCNSSYGVLKTMYKCDYLLDQVFVLEIIVGTKFNISYVIDQVGFFLDGFYVCLVEVA